MPNASACSQVPNDTSSNISLLFAAIPGHLLKPCHLVAEPSVLRLGEPVLSSRLWSTGRFLVTLQENDNCTNGDSVVPACTHFLYPSS
jgi:hypothetical protein